MNWPLRQIALLLFAGLFFISRSTVAQLNPDTTQEQTDAPCLLPDPDEQKATGPEISITEVNFTGSIQLPLSDQGQIVQTIIEKSHGTSFDDVVEEALERASAGWQNRGYFRVGLAGDARMLTSSPIAEHLALNVQVLDEGAKYTLAHISFQNNKAINSVQALRGLFPLGDGDIFSREKIAKGLENLRKAYAQLGYINFTAIPETTFDNGTNAISLLIDVDEGMQFWLTRVDVLGVDETSREEILKDAPIGQIYNQRLLELFLEKHRRTLKFSNDDPRHISRRLNEKTGTVEVFLDAKACPVS